MSNQDNLFNKDSNQENTSITKDGNVNPDFTEWVGEGKKYPTIEEMAKSAMYSQDYIQSIERERDQLRDDVQKNTSLDSILDHMTSTKNQEAPQGTPPEKSEIKSEDITSLVRNEVTSLFNQNKQQSIAESNSNMVQEQLKNKFGDKASEVLESKAKEVGLSVEQMGKIAETSPQAVLEYFRDVTPSATRTEGTFNTETTSESNNIVQGTNAYYSKMRKENPNQYYSNKIQFEMVSKAKELGEAFYQ